MADYVIHNVRLVHPGKKICTGWLRISAGRIAELGEGALPEGLSGEQVDGAGRRFTPGLIDVHTHGMGPYNYDRGAEELRAATALLGQYGTTTVVPTVVPQLDDTMWRVLPELATALPTIKDVHIPGLHLEGPFVAITGAACETRDGDVGLLKEMIAACDGLVKIMSIAPEVKNIIPVIEHLVSERIRPFITHTRASVAETQAAIDAGACHATHFYDVFPVPEETDLGVRPVGAVETILANPQVTCDFICDGIHVDPMAVKAALAAKGVEGVSLITDASFGAGMPPGTYETPWGYPVEVKPGNAPRIADPKHTYFGALAGSALTMNRGMANLLRWLDLPEEQVWSMGTRSPARVLRFAGRGHLVAGMAADVVLWDDGEDLTAAATWVNGHKVF